MMKEFDNMKTGRLSCLLNENTTLKRFYPLIPVRGKLIEGLLELGIEDKYTFFERLASAGADQREYRRRLSEKLGLGEEGLALFEQFLHLHDFTDRRLSEIQSVSAEYMGKLFSDGIKRSKDYLLLCMRHPAEEISHRYGVDEGEAVRLFCICDLMRLPGVKELRASLYLDCGFCSLQEISAQGQEAMRARIAEYIADHHIEKSVPFAKELETQIAAAKVLPHLSFGGWARGEEKE